MSEAMQVSHFPAVVFMPGDAFDAEAKQVMGRRVAGRLLVSAFTSQLRSREELTLVCPGRDGAQAIRRVVQSLVPEGAKVRLEAKLNPHKLRQVGAVHLPDPLLGQWCWLRDRLPSYSFSLTGVIHTLCSEGVIRGLQDLALAPLYPWDAVVCTSEAGRKVVAAAMEHRLQAMATRLGAPPRPAIGLPQLPVIPLAGSSSQPYYPQLDRSSRRLQARQDLGLRTDAFVVAFVGRLSFHSKAHPQALYRSLQALDPSEGPVVLVECGHHFNKAIADAYQELQRHFPRVQFRLVGGLTPATEWEKWQVLAAADVFTSPADNLQETFGLSLLEAMAAELPLVVSNWDGYRDLVEHGLNGFLVPTSDVLPSLNRADEIEHAYISQQIDYDRMVGLRSLGVVVDHAAFTAAFASLRRDPALAACMGVEARRTLLRRFSEEAVALLYRQLWAELADRRKAAALELEPAIDLYAYAPSHSKVFGHYATQAFECVRVAHTADCLPLELAVNPMNHALLMQVTGGKLMDVLAELRVGHEVGLESLRKLGFAGDSVQSLLAAFLKLGFVERID